VERIGYMGVQRTVDAAVHSTVDADRIQDGHNLLIFACVTEGKPGDQEWVRAVSSVLQSCPHRLYAASYTLV
jgi:hypothetical protein